MGKSLSSESVRAGSQKQQKEASRRAKGQSFKQIVNEALRAGLVQMGARASAGTASRRGTPTLAAA